MKCRKPHKNLVNRKKSTKRSLTSLRKMFLPDKPPTTKHKKFTRLRKLPMIIKLKHLTRPIPNMSQVITEQMQLLPNNSSVRTLSTVWTPREMMFGKELKKPSLITLMLKKMLDKLMLLSRSTLLPFPSELVYYPLFLFESVLTVVFNCPKAYIEFSFYYI